MANADDLTDDDAQLLSELARLYASTDPVPDIVIEGATAAIELRDLDAQLADLLSDSALDDKELAGVRGGMQRLLSFGNGDRFIEVDVAGAASQRTLTGYVVPATAGVLRVLHSDTQTEVPIDERGRFSVAGLVRGPVRLRIELPGLAPLVTPWLPL